MDNPTTPNFWRPSDLEAIRSALAIPVSPASIRAINDAMAALERTYPDAIPAARSHLDAIAALDAAALSGPPQPGGGPTPVIRKVTRKGAAAPVPEPLPKKKLDVIEYATELLLEEVSTEYDTAAPLPSPAGLSPGRQRQRHVDGLLLILPALQSWIPQRHSPFQGQLCRG